MTSPARSHAEHLIESQIRQRMNYFSPSKNDLDFYQRKVGRLEGDLTQLQEELSIARLRLRTAEDFEIKYELLTKQNNSLLHENGKLTKELAKRKAEAEQLNGDIHSHELVRADLERTVAKRDEEIKALQKRLDEAEQIAQMVRTSTQVSDLERQLETERHDYQKNISEYQNKLSNISKSNITLTQEVSRLHERIDELEDQLKSNSERHAGLMERVRLEWEEKMQGKEQEIQKIKQSHQQLSGVSLQDLRNRIEEKDEIFARELELLKDVLATKSREVDETIMDKKKAVDRYEMELDELRALIHSLQEKLHENELTNELELENCKERLTKLHAEDVASRDAAKSQLTEAFESEIANLKQKTLSHEEQMALLKAKYEKDIAEHKLLQDHLKRGIHELKERIHQHNQHADSQHQIMTSLNLDLEEQKKVASSDYSNNVTFLDQQLKKAGVSIEQKNLEINNLLKQLSDVRRDCEQELKESDSKWQREREELEAQLDRLTKEKKSKDDQIKKKDKDLRQKDREIEDTTAKFEAERKALQRALDEAHHDYKRMAEHTAGLEKLIRDERIKGVGNVGDLNNLRREKLAELDKQRHELEALFREQMDQTKNSMQLENDKLRVQRDRLKAEQSQLKLQYAQLQQNFKKISSLVANEARQNKDKLAEYQKKMATLNMQINLAQNLYSSFLDAKSRVNRGDKQNQ